MFNGIWQIKYGIQLSGIYFFGSGERLPTSYGGDLRRAGGNGNQLRPDGTLVLRNDFVGDADSSRRHAGDRSGSPSARA